MEAGVRRGRLLPELWPSVGANGEQPDRYLAHSGRRREDPRQSLWRLAVRHDRMADGPDQSGDGKTSARENSKCAAACCPYYAAARPEPRFGEVTLADAADWPSPHSSAANARKKIGDRVCLRCSGRLAQASIARLKLRRMATAVRFGCDQLSDPMCSSSATLKTCRTPSDNSTIPRSRNRLKTRLT